MPERMDAPETHVGGELFEAVQREAVFHDSKRFADAVPLSPPERIERAFANERDDEEFDLQAFVERQFELPSAIDLPHNGGRADSLEQHVHALWRHLRRPQRPRNEYDTLIELPHPHIVPGGRFREAYYWDSYFVAEGLAAADRFEVVADLVENFEHLIDRFGYVPNGNRRYYLGRSQLPLFCKMGEVLAESAGTDVFRSVLPALQAEHRFWMDGREPGDRHVTGERVVRLDDAVMTRYWGGEPRPRPEAHREDVRTGRMRSAGTRPRLYLDIRAACESGWDFSSRWLADPETFHSIRTTRILPVDLNACLWYLERRLAHTLDRLGESGMASQYFDLAAARSAAITRYCWDEEAGFFFDYALEEKARTNRWTLAAVAPLFFGVASDEQASGVAEVLEDRFLRPGGLVTTLTRSGEQWDAPNGWAPLHWMAVRGLRAYGNDDLADLIKQRWLGTPRTTFERDGKLVEKYDVCDANRPAGGGDYPLQDGFGWTNSIIIALDAEPRAGRYEVGRDPGPMDRV